MTDAFLDVPAIWSDLASKLTGQREHDLMTIGAFCFMFRIPHGSRHRQGAGARQTGEHHDSLDGQEPQQVTSAVMGPD